MSNFKFVNVFYLETEYSKIIKDSVEIDDGFDECVITEYQTNEKGLNVTLKATNLRSLKKSVNCLLERIQLSYDTIEMCKE